MSGVDKTKLGEAEKLMRIDKNGLVLSIETPSTFSFSQQAAFLRLFPLDCLYQVEGGAIFKAIRIQDQPALLEITSPKDGRLTVSLVHNRAVGVSQEVIQYIKEWFDLDNDLKPFYIMASKDCVLAPIVKTYGGSHIVGIPNLFEAIAWAVIGQQINLTFAYTLKRRFVQAFGESVEYGGRSYWLFPVPEKVANLTVEEFLPLQFSKKKAEYITSLARSIANGQLSKESLLALPTVEERKQKMISFKGIGSWTADYVLLKCLLEPTAFPVGDAGLQNAVKLQKGLICKPTCDELRKLALPWRGWEAYATFYLWRTLFKD